MKNVFNELVRRYDAGDESVVNDPNVLNRMAQYAKAHNINWNPAFSPDRAAESFVYNGVNTATFGLPSLFSEQPKTVGKGENFVGGAGSLLGMLVPGTLGAKAASKGFSAAKKFLTELLGKKVGMRAAKDIVSKYSEKETIKLLKDATGEVIYAPGDVIKQLTSGRINPTVFKGVPLTKKEKTLRMLLELDKKHGNAFPTGFKQLGPGF